MTIISIPENDRKERFIATAGQTSFPFDFPIYDQTDLLVLRERSGVVSTLTLGADYTVTGAGDQAGGSITLTTGATVGDILVLLSAMPSGRSTQFVNGGDLPAAALEAEFNRLRVLFQQNARDAQNALIFPSTDGPMPALPPVVTRAGRFLAFDAQGQPYAAGAPGTLLEAVARAGDTMTGALILPAANPASPNQAAHKAYVDAQITAAIAPQAEIDVPSAATTNIGAAASANLRITGTTTIIGFGTAANGVTRKLRFAGALTLTHNATSLILPGGANITTAAGDTAEAISLGSGNWVVVAFMPSSGWRGSSVVIAEAIANNSATLDITTNLDNTYDRYELELVDLKPATNDVQAGLRIGTGSGPTWQSGGSAYASSILGIGSGSTALLGNTAGGFIPLSQAAGGGNGVISLAGYPGLRGLIRFYNPESTDRWNCNISAEHFTSSGFLVSLTGGGLYGAASAITGLRFYFSSGNIASGSIRLIGYRK